MSVLKKKKKKKIIYIYIYIYIYMIWGTYEHFSLLGISNVYNQF